MESNPQAGKKRPVWVWIISLFYFLSIPDALLMFFGLLTRLQIDSSLKYISYMSLLLAERLSALVGAVLLFRLRKSAYYFFLWALIFKILINSQDVLLQGAFLWTAIGSNAALGAASILVKALIDWGLLIAICFYAKRLESTRILNAGNEEGKSITR